MGTFQNKFLKKGQEKNQQNNQSKLRSLKQGDEKKVNLKVAFSWIRKQLRSQNNSRHIKVFGRFGIGIVKYEICSCFQGERVLLFNLYNSSFVFKAEPCFLQLDIYGSNPYKSTWGHKALQFDKHNLVIVGGQDYYRRLSLIKQKEVSEFKSLQERIWPSIAIDRQKRIFLISGAQSLAKREVFFIQDKKFQYIADYEVDCLENSCSFLNKLIQFWRLQQLREYIDSIFSLFQNKWNKQTKNSYWVFQYFSLLTSDFDNSSNFRAVYLFDGKSVNYFAKEVPKGYCYNKLINFRGQVYFMNDYNQMWTFDTVSKNWQLQYEVLFKNTAY